MIKWNSIVVGILCGVISESILYAPATGFYIVPIILMSILYSVLPLTVQFLNICIAWLFGVLCFFVWSLVLTGGLFFSLDYFFHLLIIITFSALIIYAATSKK